jgi:uncharacterized 2Fe-2S/4Fe-4S cluster protein (DUF4445 family)
MEANPGKSTPVEVCGMTYLIHFEPWGADVRVEGDLTLLDAARQADVAVSATCSGRGTCGKCQVRIASGYLPPPTPADVANVPPPALENGFRLACQHKVAGDVTLEVLPVVSHGKAQAPLFERSFPFAPAIHRRVVQLEPPSLHRPIDDGSNLLNTLTAMGAGPVEIDYRVAQDLPGALRSGGWRVALSLRDGKLVAVRRAADAAPPLGLAVDLGTTNIAAYLYSLTEGTLFGVFGAANPLSTYGADIISRLTYASRSAANGAQMQRVLVKGLNLLIEQCTVAAGYAPADIEELVVVGNSGMHHLFLDFPSRQLISSPYVPAARQARTLRARELGIAAHRAAAVYFPPLVGGFVGSDLLAVALATRIDLRPGIRLAVDIGTNTELLLSVNGELFCASTASGPALEGAALQFGSVAMPGAVDHVSLRESGAPFAVHTIRNRPAIGICGSGIIEALGVMRRAGVISHTGRIQAAASGVVESSDGDHRFVLVPAEETALGVDLTISQTDVRAIQLAKGAIRAGMETLLLEHGLSSDQLDEILIAGTFGSHIQIESSVQIGLFPGIPLGNIRQIGNAAGTGAVMMLLSTSERGEAEHLSGRIHYTELARHRRFTRLFADSQRFPE